MILTSQNWVRLFLITIMIMIPAYCATANKPKGLETENLKITKLGEHTYLHVSYLNIPGYGYFPCNGLIYHNQGEALIFDTPVSAAVTDTLIRWIQEELECDVIGMVANHFHQDCMGGVEELKKRQIPVIASQSTLEECKRTGKIVPDRTFDLIDTISVGDQFIINEYLGHAHSSDNIVSYIDTDQILFGGCMIKEIGAGKGNLNDADIKAWPRTLQLVKSKYDKAILVVPGHGKVGDLGLIDYTIKLFSQ